MVNRKIAICVCICLLRGTTSNDTPVAMSKPGTQILVPEYHSPWKGSKVSWRTADSRAGVGKVQDEPGTFCCTKK